MSGIVIYASYNPQKYKRGVNWEEKSYCSTCKIWPIKGTVKNNVCEGCRRRLRVRGRSNGSKHRSMVPRY